MDDGVYGNPHCDDWWGGERSGRVGEILRMTLADEFVRREFWGGNPVGAWRNDSEKDCWKINMDRYGLRS